ncbi:ferredoxin [bacterium]|nr:ferredoxin [bacterium]
MADALAPEEKALEAVAELMCLAARTAPKARGLDNLVIRIVRGDEKARVTARMREVGTTVDGAGFFARDADNCDGAPLVVLVGTRVGPVGVPHCGFCGFGDCEGCATAGGLCNYNAGDLGIALGSAAAVAAAHHADNRMMFSFGKAAIELGGILPADVKIAIGMPLSATGKNPFFDRK